MGSVVLRRLFIVALVLLIGAAGFIYWQRNSASVLPQGIASGNGRLEATEVDIATKVAGRLASVSVHEGDDVVIGQVLAELDVKDLKAQLRSAEAQVRQAHAAMQQSRAAEAGAASQRRLAQTTFNRTEQLVKKNFVSDDRLDRDYSAVQTADATTSAARSRVQEASEEVAAAEARCDVMRILLDDATLKASVAGRVLYRLAQQGEILPAGGKVLTLLDMSDVYFSLYLPANEAGKIRVGSTARIVLDSLPGNPIPAKAVFVSPRSQFTPKEVETFNEREKLMFRVKVQVEPDWLAAHANLAKPGMPGMAYVLTDPSVSWPPALTPR
jgi:HlyD family secretion protein